MTAPPILHVRGRDVDLSAPLIMGVLNASPESFSDPGERTPAELLGRGRALVRAGAGMLDIGGESARTDRAAAGIDVEIERVAPLIAAVKRELDVLVSVDTWKPAVAAAAVEAGADVVNDISGLRDVGLAEVCAASGAGLVITHNPGIPKVRALDAAAYDDVPAAVESFLRERLDVARDAGVAAEQTLLDPGPDIAKTPAQTVQALRALERLHAIGRPLLLAVSRKDFVGVLVGRAPRGRDSGTLAAIDDGVRRGAAVLRVHDVAGVNAFLAARAAARR